MSPGRPEAFSTVVGTRFIASTTELYRTGRPELDGFLHEEQGRGRDACGPFVWSEADIPRPMARSDSAILMEYLGDRRGPALALQNVELSHNEVYPIFEQLMRNVELWLTNNYIHADLSAYNVLYWQGQISIIDFPQAIDPRFNPNALDLLTRDIENICHYIARYGLERDGYRIARRLWQRFKNAEL